MELADSGKAAFGHLDHGLRGDCFHVVGRQTFQEPVHQRAPGPEAVLPRGARLGHPGHGALEGVGMQVHRRRQQAGEDLSLRLGARRHLGDAPGLDPDTDIPGPAIGEQGSLGVKKHGDSLDLNYV